VPTLANAMDVGDPSNMERLNALFGNVERLRDGVRAYAVTDAEIRTAIRRDDAELGHVWCPHTAAAAHVYRQLVMQRPSDDPRRWIIVATAHPAKFNEVVEPAIGREVAIPPALERLLSLPRQEEELPATLEAFRDRLEKGGRPAIQ
jgi:threonine synthase